MSVLEFIAAVSGHLLSWPIIAVVITYILRTPIGALLARLKTYEGLGQKMEFGDRLATAESDVDAAVEATSSGQPIAEDEPEHGLPSSMALVADTNPSYAVLAAFEQLGGAVADLAASALSETLRPAIRAPLSLLPRLQQLGIVNSEFVKAATELRDLRNKVAHGHHNPSAGEAAAYASSAEELTRAARALGKFHSARQGDGSVR